MTNIRAELKQQTKSVHEELEGALAIMRRDLTVEEYKNILCGFFKFYKPFENCLRDSPLRPAQIYWPQRAKLPAIDSDLSALGIEAPNIEALSIAADFDFLSDEGAMWGAIYVIEGSSLGGQVISPFLRETLGLTPENGAAYFSGYGKETGSRWKQFLEELEKAADQHSHRSIVDGALRTFKLLIKQFTVSA